MEVTTKPIILEYVSFSLNNNGDNIIMIEKKLEQADKLLSEITVKGEDAFYMVDARRLLKDIYDMIKERTNGEQSDI